METGTIVAIAIAALLGGALLLAGVVLATRGKGKGGGDKEAPLLDKARGAGYQPQDYGYGEDTYHAPPPEPAPAAYANLDADPSAGAQSRERSEPPPHPVYEQGRGNAYGEGGGYGAGGPEGGPPPGYEQPPPQGASPGYGYAPPPPPQQPPAQYGVEREGLHFQLMSIARNDEQSAPGTELYRSLAVRVRAWDANGEVVGEEVSWPFVMLQPPSVKLWWGTTRYMKCGLGDVDFLEIMIVAPAEHELRHSRQGGVHLYANGSVRMSDFLKYLPYGSNALSERIVLEVPCIAVDPVDAGLEVVATVALQPSPEIRKTICLWKLPGEVPNDPPGLSSASRAVVNEMYHELNEKVHDTALKDIATIYSCPSIAGVQCGMCYLAPLLRHAGVANFDNKVTISRYADPDAKFKKGLSVEEFAHLLRSRTEQLFADVEDSLEFLGKEKALLDASSLFSIRTGLTWVDPRYPQAARNDATAEFFNQIAYTPGGMCLMLTPTAAYEFLQRYLTHEMPLDERNALLFAQPFTVAELDIDMTKEYPITAIRYVCAMDLDAKAEAAAAQQQPAVIIRHKVVESPAHVHHPPPGGLPAVSPNRPMSPGRTRRYPDFDYDPIVDVNQGPGVHTPVAAPIPPPRPAGASVRASPALPPPQAVQVLPPPPASHPHNHISHAPRVRAVPSHPSASPGRRVAEQQLAAATDGYTRPAFSKEPVQIRTNADVIRELDRAAHLPPTFSTAGRGYSLTHASPPPRHLGAAADASPHGSLGEMLTRERELSLARQELEAGSQELIRLSQERRAVAPEALGRHY